MGLQQWQDLAECANIAGSGSGSHSDLAGRLGCDELEQHILEVHDIHLAEPIPCGTCGEASATLPDILSHTLPCLCSAHAAVLVVRYLPCLFFTQGREGSVKLECNWINVRRHLKSHLLCCGGEAHYCSPLDGCPAWWGLRTRRTLALPPLSRRCRAARRTRRRAGGCCGPAWRLDGPHQAPAGCLRPAVVPHTCFGNALCALNVAWYVLNIRGGRSHLQPPYQSSLQAIGFFAMVSLLRFWTSRERQEGL